MVNIGAGGLSCDVAASLKPRPGMSENIFKQEVMLEDLKLFAEPFMTSVELALLQDTYHCYRCRQFGIVRMHCSIGTTPFVADPSALHVLSESMSVLLVAAICTSIDLKASPVRIARETISGHPASSPH